MKTTKPRLMYIDLLRGWAVLVMIEVHVVNAFIRPELRQESWFTVLNFINGLVAPTFLFVTGYAFVLVAQRKWNDYLALNSVFFRQLGRIAQIWAAGYALHIPVFSLTRMMQESDQMWMTLWKVDVLHCIAASLMIMLLLVVAARRQSVYIWCVSAIGLLVIFSAPFVWQMNVDGMLPVFAANYVNAVHGSLFPLVPWLGFVFFGGMVSYAVVHLKAKMEDRKIFTGILIAGVALIVVNLALTLLPFDLYPPHLFGRTSPLFVFIRIGIVLILLSTLYFWEQTWKSTPSVVSVAGAESLVAYSFHLMMIYGMFYDNRSLSFIIGKTRGIPELAAMTLALIAVTVLVSYVWNWIKRTNMTYARVMQYSLLAVVLYIFITKPQ